MVTLDNFLRVNINFAPTILLFLPNLFSTVIIPLCISNICLTILKPNPECWPNFSSLGLSV